MKYFHAFPYFGSKLGFLDWLLPMIPSSEIYVEPFGGSGAVLLNKQKSPVSVYADINPKLVQFFTELRDCPERLLQQIGTKCLSREQYYHSVYNHVSAADFYQTIQMTFGAVTTPSLGRIADTYEKMAFVKSYNRLLSIAEKIKEVHFYCSDAVSIIKKYDSPNTLIYCDPPYVASTRQGNAYFTELKESDHILLAECLNNCVSKVCVSGYDSGIYDELYFSPKWQKTNINRQKSSSRLNQGNNCAREVVWTNYCIGRSLGRKP